MLKLFRSFIIVVFLFFILTGIAAAAEYEHFTGVMAYGDKIYALVNRETNTGFYDFVYYPCRVIEYDSALRELRRIELSSGTDAAKNANSFVLHNGKLYVGCTGSATPNTEWGSIWEVDIANWNTRKILDAKDTGTVQYSGVMGVETAADGTAFLLFGSYNASFDFSPALFVTTVDKMIAGDAGTPVTIAPSEGYSWSIDWSEASQTLWMAAGKSVQARSKNGTVLSTFTQSDLGNNVGSIRALSDGRAFYTAVPDNYSSTSAGLIRKNASTYTPQKDVLTNLAGDTAGFAFNDNNGKPFVLMREYNYGPNDNIFIYDPDDFSSPVMNVSNWGSNISTIATLNNYMYYGTYERYEAGNSNQLSGEIKRVNLQNLIPIVPPIQQPSSGGGGGGCDAGFGALALVILFQTALIRYLNKTKK